MGTVRNTPKLPDQRERLVSAAPVEDDSSFELKLRPQRLGEFIGQSKVKENLAVAIEAARSRGEALDHVLLYGPPGLGKTTLATIIANELGAAFQQTSGPTLQIKGDLTAVLTNLRDKQVLFIDEVHRLQPTLEEILYSALEDYKLDILIGQGPAARTHTMDVKPFTFVGATTRAGLLSAPLRSRFGIVLRLEFYGHEDLRIIVERSAEILGVEINREGVMRIMRTSAWSQAVLRNSKIASQPNGFGPHVASVETDWDEVRKDTNTIAGSFSSFLLATRGAERLRALYRSAGNFSHLGLVRYSQAQAIASRLK